MHINESRILAHSPDHTIFARLSRHRWSALALAVTSLFTMVTAFGTAPPSATDIRREVVVEKLLPPSNTAIDLSDDFFVHEDLVQQGDTVGSILARLGMQDAAATAFIKQNSTAQTIARQLRPGKIVQIKTDASGSLKELTFPLNGRDASLTIKRHQKGFSATEQNDTFLPKQVSKAGIIKSSLFAATDEAGIPDTIATQLADIFGSDIDFHRDLRKGDRFALTYEEQHQGGRSVKSGRILAAEFTNQNKTYRAIYFRDSTNHEAKGNYYTADGKSLRKAFLRSPLEFSRITSGFTNARFHPILQQWRAHKGVDYGAPTGTRVRATADGVVEFAGQQGGYGNLLILRHQGHFSTAYGHLNKFATGLRKGSKINQGDLIGFVGQTGWATGPHLHYEFRINNEQVNPLAVSTPSAQPLTTAQLPHFRSYASQMLSQLEQMRSYQIAATFE